MLTRSKTNKDTIFYTLPLIRRRLSWKCASSIYEYIYRGKSNSSLFTKLLAIQGKKFERMVVYELSQLSKLNIPSISFTLSKEAYEKTITHMKLGKPIIHSAPVQNKKNRTRGIVDLLVRSDYLHHFFPNQPIPQKKGCLFSPHWHYIVIEIKYSTLDFKVDGIHLLNSHKTKYAKAQTFIYNQAIGEIQGYTPSFSYILGRQYIHQDNIVKKFNLHLGKVDFSNVDSFVESEVKNAIQWLKHKKNKMIPSNDVCYDDITKIWYCTDKHSDILKHHNITSIMDPRCNASLLGFKNNRKMIIDAILDTQRQTEPILPKKGVRVPPKEDVEYFVDFETIPEALIDPLNSMYCKRTCFIFLIGVGFFDDKGLWNYRAFRMETLTLKEELRVMREFKRFVKHNPLYHWDHAEPSCWKHALSRHRKNYSLQWVDLLKVFTTTPITIKGCFNFKLKEVCRAMKSNGLIDVVYDSISNGLDCAALAVHYYQTGAGDFTDIVHYNEMDVKSVGEILYFLRKTY